MSPNSPIRHPRPKWLTFLINLALLAGILALILSIQNAVDLGHQADQRNADRIAADLQGCARGNVFRQQVIDLAKAVDHLDTQILDTAYEPPPGIPANVTALIRARRARFDAPLAAFRKASGQIHLIDCKAVTPGATDTTKP